MTAHKFVRPCKRCTKNGVANPEKLGPGQMCKTCKTADSRFTVNARKVR